MHSIAQFNYSRIFTYTYINQKSSQLLISMSRFFLPIIFISFIVLLLASCGIGKGDLLVEEITYPFDSQKVWETADSTRNAQQGWMYADIYSREYYSNADRKFLWASEHGIDDCTDTLLKHLQNVENYALKRSSFCVDEIESALAEFRELKPDSCDEGTVVNLQGRLESLLSRAYMRYAFGQRFGYVRPYRIFNRLLVDKPAPDQEITDTVYRKIFDLRCDQPSKEFFTKALAALENADTLGAFLRHIQPKDSLYFKMQKAWQSAHNKESKSQERLLAINLERSRWRYPRPADGKFVWINLADFMLTAVDTKRDTMLTMRVCGGDMHHKSPLLTSRITYLELNPYWVIPFSIIRKEIIPHHLNDSSYFARNRIVAINKDTQQEHMAWTLNESQLRSGKYTLRQEKGEGNSIGRMIFRFPNDFSVYLHDTPNQAAFSHQVRAVSHGCIRLQRPYDLAMFLIDDANDLFIDKFRIALELPPLTEKGARLLEKDPEYQGLKGYSFKPAVPVFLDYYTIYPDFKTGEMVTHPDNYDYDGEIEKVLNQF